MAVTIIVLSLWLHFLYFVLLLGYSVHQLRLPVAVLSLLPIVPPILLVFWAVLFCRMELRIIAGPVLVCSWLLVYLFLSLQRSMLHLLLLARLIILFAIVENSKLILLSLPSRFSILRSNSVCSCFWFCKSSIWLRTFWRFWFLPIWAGVFKLDGLGNPQDWIIVCL